MQVCNHSDIIEIWLTRADQADPAVQSQVSAICAQCRAAGNMAVIYRSGLNDLIDNTAELLRYNRRRSAERDVTTDQQRRKREMEMSR